jgi:hypothetical protein
MSLFLSDISPKISKSFFDQLASGSSDEQITFISGLRVFTGSTNNQTIWGGPTQNVPFVDTAVTMSVVSTSASDDVGQSGANTIHIQYLDQNLDSQVIEVEMNGLTSVVTHIQARFIQDFHVEFVGSSNHAVGDITVYNGATVFGIIKANKMKSYSSAYVVPRNKRLIITDIVGSSASGSSLATTIMSISSNSINGHVAPSLIPLMTIALQDNSQTFSPSMQIAIKSETMVCFTATVDKSTTVAGSMIGYLETVV